MKCYLILVLLCLSIYIKSDYPSCEQITPKDAEDCKNAVSQKEYCCSLLDKKDFGNHVCMEKTMEEIEQINISEIKHQCYKTQSASSPQTPTSSKDSSRSRASSSSFYLEVGVLISIFLLL